MPVKGEFDHPTLRSRHIRLPFYRIRRLRNAFPHPLDEKIILRVRIHGNRDYRLDDSSIRSRSVVSNMPHYRVKYRKRSRVPSRTKRQIRRRLLRHFIGLRPPNKRKSNSPTRRKLPDTGRTRRVNRVARMLPLLSFDRTHGFCSVLPFEIFEMTRRQHTILEQLYRDNADSLLGFVNRRMDVQDAEDLVQNAFLRMAEAAPERPIENPLGYLYRISANLIVDHLRHRQRRFDFAALEDDALEVHDPAPDMEAMVFSRQQIDLLKQALRELPPRCREVFILHKFRHLSYAEIAARLQISESTVVKQMIKALAHCKRQVYGKEEKEE